MDPSRKLTFSFLLKSSTLLFCTSYVHFTVGTTSKELTSDFYCPRNTMISVDKVCLYSFMIFNTDNI